MSTLSHTGISSTHDSARTHIPLHPFTSVHLETFPVLGGASQNLDDPQRNFKAIREPLRTLAIRVESCQTWTNLSEPSETYRISANLSELLRAIQNMREPKRTCRVIEKPKNLRERRRTSQK